MRGLQTEAGASLIAATSASPRRPRAGLVAVVLILAALVLYLDRTSKLWALAELTPGVPRPLLGEVLQLHLLFNPGAAFSLGTGITPVFTVIMVLVVVAILIAMLRVTSRLWAVGLGLLLGGALGNLTDRLTRPPGFGRGYVVDFLQLPNWPVFNVADSGIVAAAGLIALAAFRGIPFAGRAPTLEEADGALALEEADGTPTLEEADGALALEEADGTSTLEEADGALALEEADGTPEAGSHADAGAPVTTDTDEEEVRRG